MNKPSELLERLIIEIAEDHFNPIIERLKADIATLKGENKFISYPKGFKEYFNCSYDKARRIWLKKDFPRVINKTGETEVKGAYSHEIESYLRGRNL